MPLITVSQGGPEIEPGVYPVILVAIEGPKTIIPQGGPNAGQEIEIFDWKFAVDEGDYDGTEIQATSSTASGPRSKMFAFLTALLGGKPPAVGQTFEAADLCGRRALATISRSDSGWPRVENLGAMPASMLSTRVAQATGAPLKGLPPVQAARPATAPRAAQRPATQPLRQQVSPQSTGDLPF